MPRLLRFAVCCLFVVTLPALALADEGDSPPPSFVNDIEPILTRYGCNQGACHGKGAGQNGFRLSLRGYAPELDHDWIVKDQQGRRINRVWPEQSLLILKALGHVPHGGGRAIRPKSQAAGNLLAWLFQGAPGPLKGERQIQSVTISTGDRVMKVGEELQLAVTAGYSDGSSRDVTWLTQFASNDAGLVEVDADGKLNVLRSGETAIRAHYQGQVAVAVVTVPFERSSLVPSPPSSGERARVRGPSGDTASNSIKTPQQSSSRNDPPTNSKAPLTLTLSPENGGEGTKKTSQPPGNFIDEHVAAKLAALNIPASRLSSDEMFLRRVYLDTIGTLPTEDEVRAFVADARADKREKVIDELLQRPEFVDLWTMLLADLFQNRKERDHDVRGTKGVRAFHQWLREQVAANRPWNELARAVLTSQGNTDEHPEIGYYVVTIGEFRQTQQSDVVASVAQAFLGTRIGCAKCHNHPLEKYTQDDYYHFAAFFSRVQFDRKNPQAGPTELMQATEHQQNQQRHLANLQKQLAEKAAAPKPEKEEDQKKLDQQVADLRMQVEGVTKEIESIRMSPVMVQQPRTNQQLKPQPLDRAELAIAPGSDPRAALADWMTSGRNESFNGSIVNRVWQHFLGVGLVEPVDDIRASNPPTNPALWKALNAEFVAHGFDLRHLMRTILNSRTYQLSSESLTDNEADTKFYSHYYARRLPAELLLDALSQVTAIPDQFPGYPEGIRAQQLPDPALDSYFLRLFGRSDRVTACACERTGDVTMSQLLHLQNGDTITRKLEAGESRLAELLKSTPDNAALIERLFLTTLARKPTETEANAALNALTSGDPRDTIFRDLLWALLNSKEFAFNH